MTEKIAYVSFVMFWLNCITFYFAQSRVTACIERVEDILDLKYCTDGVQQALQNEDYEKVGF